jgi:hypothetical protein
MTQFHMPQSTPAAPTDPDSILRERALTRLKKKRDFYGHVMVYLTVNSFLVAIWWLTSSGFFWPGIVMGAWGIGLIMNAWDVWQGEFSDADIEREVARLQRRR